MTRNNRTCVRLAALGFVLGLTFHASGQFLDTSKTPAVPTAESTGANEALLQQLMSASEGPIPIRPGDVYTVSIFGIENYDAKGRVGNDGVVILPLVGPITLAGLTPSQAQQAIAEKLKNDGVVLNPQVNFLLTDSPSQTVAVTGEVNRAGAFPCFGRHQLYEFIARAEGFKNTAGHTVTLIRPSLSSPVQIPLGPDPSKAAFASIPVFAGDTIIVPSVGVVYVVGALKAQGMFPLRAYSPTTALQAVALAGGAGYEAQLDSSVIVRKLPTGSVELAIHLHRIMKGKEQDVPLQPNDILLVPTGQMKAAIKGGAASLAGSLASAYIYSHQF